MSWTSWTSPGETRNKISSNHEYLAVLKFLRSASFFVFFFSYLLSRICTIPHHIHRTICGTEWRRCPVGMNVHRSNLQICSQVGLCNSSVCSSLFNSSPAQKPQPLVWKRLLVSLYELHWTSTVRGSTRYLYFRPSSYIHYLYNAREQTGQRKNFDLGITYHRLNLFSYAHPQIHLEI